MTEDLKHFNSGLPSSGRTVNLKTGVPVDAMLAVTCARKLRGLSTLLPEEFHSLASSIEELNAGPVDSKVFGRENFPFLADGSLDPIARLILKAGLITGTDGRHMFEDPFDRTDENTAQVVNSLERELDQKTGRILNALSNNKKQEPHSRGSERG